ncbi:MAG: tRNA (adenosine(37)-N6)-dimethylallyltransferase MiaA [Terrimesophilobacter sp.]
MPSVHLPATLPLITIVGATGTGKSALSLNLVDALRVDGCAAEIVNADAMQLYRGMDIGTAKLPVAERRGIPHHLFDVLDVTEEATVAAYQQAARVAISEVRSRGAVPIVVGGSGLYVSSILFDFQFPGSDAEIRAGLEREAAEHGSQVLIERLTRLDPNAAAAIGPHNVRRIIRALEVIAITGEPFGSGLPDENRTSEPLTIIGLTTPRPELVARLNERVLHMWRGGLVEEVGGLLEIGLDRGVTARRAIGYAQAIAQLRGEISENDAIEATSALTRRYARRQVGWFKRYPSAHWFETDDHDLVGKARALALAHGRTALH